MDELQDAIEDAQYINATQNDSPYPTARWAKATKAEIHQYLSNARRSNSRILELEGICEGSLGFYLFLDFLCENKKFEFANFLMDVATFRVSNIV